MHVREFDFDLPPDLIAQAPPASREERRLLLRSQPTGRIVHSRMSLLPEYLQAGDLLVANNTRVFPARLIGVRVPSGGGVECLLVGQVESASDRSEVWEALVHPGQKLKPGAR